MFAKIYKRNNKVIEILEVTDNHPWYYYVETEIIEKNSNQDEIFFNLNTPLTADEVKYNEDINPLIKTTNDGSFTHKYTKDQCDDIEVLLRNRALDKVTYNMIKEWCLVQPEGCEEAFFNMDKTSARYLVYKAKKEEIIDSRTDLKQATKTNLTLADITHLL
jgi:hypothetical protein